MLGHRHYADPYRHGQDVQFFYCEYTVVSNVSKSYAFTNPKNSSKFQEVYISGTLQTNTVNQQPKPLPPFSGLDTPFA